MRHAGAAKHSESARARSAIAAATEHDGEPFAGLRPDADATEDQRIAVDRPSGALRNGSSAHRRPGGRMAGKNCLHRFQNLRPLAGEIPRLQRV
ncbi:MAG: hypothetical protein D6725_12490, partial [Planctomycetota bacterium]